MPAVMMLEGVSSLETLTTVVTMFFTWVSSALGTMSSEPLLLLGTAIAVAGGSIGLLFRFMKRQFGLAFSGSVPHGNSFPIMVRFNSIESHHFLEVFMLIFELLNFFLRFIVGFVHLDLTIGFLGIVVGICCFAFLRKWIGW